MRRGLADFGFLLLFGAGVQVVSGIWTRRWSGFFLHLFSGLLYLFLFRTDTGRTIRAAADNTYGARVIGVDVSRVYAVAFGVGAACVGAAGALTAPILPFQPAFGLSASVTSVGSTSDRRPATSISPATSVS